MREDWREALAARLFVVLFYGLLMFDALIDATRSGWVQPSTLTVTKLPWLFEDGLRWAPSPGAVAEALHATALFAGVSAVAPRAVFPFAAVPTAVFYTFAYFATELNRYQHKYMLCVLLWVTPFVLHSVRARRLVLAVVGIVYGWTAVAKLADDGAFLSASILPLLLMRSDFHDLAGAVGGVFHVHDVWVWRAVSASIVCAEATLAALFITRRRPVVAALLGASLHIGIELAGVFRISFFSYYMLILYVLLATKL